MNRKTKELIINHCRTYPKALPQDIFKFLYQSTFGCEHMIASPEAVAEYIKKEAEAVTAFDGILTETLDGDFSRVHLAYLSKGLSAETLGKLFYLSSEHKTEGYAILDEKLKALAELASTGELPFSLTEFEKALEKWRDNGCRAIHHSEVFRESYKPAYRVISNDYVPFLPVLAAIDGMLAHGKVRLAVEGGSASGKSTFGELLEKLYDCTVFHMDDFFLRPEQRTPQRFSEIGGNVDRERFLSQVLEPLGNDKPVYYRRFDCSSQSLLPPVEVTPKKLTVIEGAYCMHIKLSEFYNLSVFLDISPELQKKRIQKRNSPELAQRFFNDWIPMEKRYFEGMDVKSRCDLVVSVE